MTIADTELKFCYLILHTYLEGTVSQIVIEALVFILCQNSGNIL